MSDVLTMMLRSRGQNFGLDKLASASAWLGVINLALKNVVFNAQ